MIKNHERQFNLMVLPGIILVVIFAYIPMVGLMIAFKDYTFASGILDSKWIGFENFITFFKDPYFSRVMKNTLLLGITTLIFTFPAPIILALLFNELQSRKTKKVYQTISYLPYFVSTVIIVGLMKSLFDVNGVVNDFINILGMKDIIFFNRPEWFRPLYIISYIWQTTGYGAIVYIAAIASLDQDMYEAAKIDGANRLQIMTKITLPSIMPTILILLILAIGGIVGNDFERIYLMYSPLTYSTADVISTYVYRSGIVSSRFGFATAMGLFNSLISIILLWSANRFSRKISETSLW